jgi:hypothetical protein
VGINIILSLLLVIVIFLVFSGTVLITIRNIKKYRVNDEQNTYLYSSNSKTKTQIIIVIIISEILSVCFAVILFLYIKYFAILVVKDLPAYITSKFQYTTGTIEHIQVEKQSNIVFINGLKLYESKVFLRGKLIKGKRYKIAYLKNTNYCVEYDEQ